MEKTWLIKHDPTNTFVGDYGKEEFEIGLINCVWPHNSIWYNREVRGYFRVYLRQDTKRIGSPKKWIKKLKSEAGYEKPPVGQRKGYR